jgi:hypothetical protein
MHLILFGMHYRTIGPYLTVIHRILIYGHVQVMLHYVVDRTSVLSQEKIWAGLRQKLKPGGAVLVNLGHCPSQSSEGGDLSKAILNSMSRAFDGAWPGFPQS